MSHLFVLRRATLLFGIASLLVALMASSDGSAFGPTVGRVPDDRSAEATKTSGPRVAKRRRDRSPRQPNVLLGRSLPNAIEGRPIGMKATLFRVPSHWRGPSPFEPLPKVRRAFATTGRTAGPGSKTKAWSLETVASPPVVMPVRTAILISLTEA